MYKKALTLLIILLGKVDGCTDRRCRANCATNIFGRCASLWVFLRSLHRGIFLLRFPVGSYFRPLLQGILWCSSPAIMLVVVRHFLFNCLRKRAFLRAL